MPGIFDPLLPQAAIDPLQKRLEQRRLDQSPLEAQVLGFGSGALEGLRNLTSPVNLAGMLPGGAAAKLLQFAPKAARMAGPTMDLLEAVPVRQIMPAMDDVSALIGSMKHNLAKVPQAGTRAAQQASQIPASFGPQATAPGAPIQGLKRAVDPFMDEFANEMFTKNVGRMR